MNHHDTARYLNTLVATGSWHVYDGDSRQYVRDVIGDHAAGFWEGSRFVDAQVTRMRSALPDYPDEVIATVDYILQERCAYFAGEVARRFGVDLTVSPLRPLPWARPPQHELEWQFFRLLRWQHSWFAFAHAKLRGANGLPVGEQARFAIAVYQSAFLELGPSRAFQNARDAQNASAREAACHVLAGWARSQLQPAANPDLQLAIRAEAKAIGCDEETAFRDLLSVAIWIALDQQGTTFDPRSLLKAVEREVVRHVIRTTVAMVDDETGELGKRRVRITTIALEDETRAQAVDSAHDGLEALLVQEDQQVAARELGALLERGTPAERELLAVLLEQVNSGRKMNLAAADRALNLKPGTAKVRLHRCREKVKKAM